VKFTPLAAVTSTNLPGVAAGGTVAGELCPRDTTGARIIIATMEDLFT
jgi:hypothetical protein